MHLPGLHHVTAVTGDAQKNIDFYGGALGLRLVKITVNFDDPCSYHLYYGDEAGRPGTLVTFFVWNGCPRGHAHAPQITRVGLALPAAALSYWQDRLQALDVPFESAHSPFGQAVLRCQDPDGLKLDLVAVDDPGGQPPQGGPVPADSALRGLYNVTIAELQTEATADLLSHVMRWQPAGQAGALTRYRAPDGPLAAQLDLELTPNAEPARMGAGSVHHVAFRVADAEQQTACRAALSAEGLHVSPAMDRCYFRSIYFHEPGGVLFEIATDGPGFTADEAADALGRRLQLPPWMESDRHALEHALPPLELPAPW